LLRHVDIADGCGLEIGPLDKALVERVAGRRIHYCDYATREVLRQNSSADPAVDIDRIPEIDFVTAQLRAESFGDMRFDYVIASHVIEHVPDMLGWLRELLRVLKPGGRIVLAVPDRRYTFDLIRPETTLGQVLEAHLLGRSRPSFGQVYDGFSMAVKADTIACWKGEINTALLERYYTRDFALTLALDTHERDGHHDCHCWVFTYESFLGIIDEAKTLGYLAARVAASEPPAFGTNEFHVVLESSGTD
jgi:predicted SAM-dependent methyltransferase